MALLFNQSGRPFLHCLHLIVCLLIQIGHTVAYLDTHVICDRLCKHEHVLADDRKVVHEAFVVDREFGLRSGEADHISQDVLERQGDIVPILGGHLLQSTGDGVTFPVPVKDGARVFLFI